MVQTYGLTLFVRRHVSLVSISRAIAGSRCRICSTLQAIRARTSVRAMQQTTARCGTLQAVIAC